MQAKFSTGDELREGGWSNSAPTVWKTARLTIGQHQQAEPNQHQVRHRHNVYVVSPCRSRTCFNLDETPKA